MTGSQQRCSASLSALLQAASQKELKEKELCNRLNVLEKLAASHIEQLNKLNREYSELVEEKRNKMTKLDEHKSQRDMLENSLSKTQSSKVNLEQVYMTTKKELELITKNYEDEEKRQTEVVVTHKQGCIDAANNFSQLKSTILKFLLTTDSPKGCKQDPAKV